MSLALKGGRDRSKRKDDQRKAACNEDNTRVGLQDGQVEGREWEGRETRRVERDVAGEGEGKEWKVRVMKED
ncbi:hypothetical protein E2C01_076195 [Portunus trituberculatus]|uniref:Uncharacterized protein n=1 Tax=Portunus trituberculatus TaxID=210409 RepID=A0A5B7IAT2_PORTR|nr:hypothetical protein [Portunus trituberculatus]